MQEISEFSASKYEIWRVTFKNINEELTMVVRNCISLFSGGGGLDLGLEAAGFETLLASDIDEHSCRSLEKNKRNARALKKPFLQNAKILCEDANDLQGASVLKLAGLNVGELDLLAGGPPCQAFSVFGKRKGRADPRGMLAYTYLRLISELKPKAFIFENVYVNHEITSSCIPKYTQSRDQGSDNVST